MSKVLVIEDEAPLRRALRIFLEAHDYEVALAASGREGLDLAAREHPDVVILDLGLPDMDGVGVATALRGWSTVPIVVLSARDTEPVKVAALDAGADDYVTKPFGFQELLARMRVALRHASKSEPAPVDAVFTSGPLRVDLARRRVRVGGKEVRLTPTEYKLLAVLVRHAGRVVTHRQLLLEVWGPWSTEEYQYLRVYMTHLRRKLEPDPLHPVLFETDAGVGYRLRTDGD